ncbi:lipopolysaccharide biosynthesis protein [Mycolicibacterium gilvum]
MSLLILPFITLAMSPAEYGAASILTASSLLLVAVVAAPLEQLVFRASAREDEDAPALIRTAGAYCYIGLPAIAGLSAVVVALVQPELFGISGRIWAIEVLAIGFQPAATYFALPCVRARQDLRKFVWLALTSVVFTAGSKLIFIVILELGVLGWAISDLISGVLSALIAILAVRLPRARITWRRVRYVLNFSLPLIPHRASFWALLSLSRPAMATVTTLTQVGLLSFGLNLASVASMIVTEIQQAVLPRYSRERFPAPTDETKTPVRIQLVVAVAVPAIVGAGIAIAGQWVFAASYWQSFALTGILLCGQAAWGLYLIPMNYLVQAAGRPKFSALASMSGAAVIMLGIFTAGARFGALGAAFATTSGFIVMAVVALILTRLLHLDIRWRTWSACWPEVLIGTISLGLSVAALSLPIGSLISYGFAAATIILATGATVSTLRRRSPAEIDAEQ